MSSNTHTSRLRVVHLFLAFLLKNFVDDRCQRSAAALSYTTLLSLVPLTAVVFSIFAAFPVFQSVAADIQDFVFKNFVPASGEVVQQYLEEFTSKASRLTAIGVTFLMLSALLLMNTIDAAINEIWHVTKPRKALPKFMVYWAVLTLGPVLMGASLAITSYVTSLPFFTETTLLSGLRAQVLIILPFLATTLACTLLYAVVPNTQVPLRYAAIGALVAAALFELAKKGFAFYVTTFPTYEMVYGALATIPVFLVWVYVSWLVILFGAEIAFSLVHFHKQGVQGAAAPTGLKLLHDFRVIGQLWQSQCWGELLTLDDLLKADPFLDQASATEALERLARAGLVHLSTDQRWALSKDMSELTLADLYGVESLSAPEFDPAWGDADPWNQRFIIATTQANEKALTALEIPLRAIYRPPEEKGGN